MTKKLNPAFSFSFEIPIWRILSDEAARRWVVELRDTTAHEVRYIIIDLTTKHSFKQDLLIEDAWWTGITAFQEDKLVIHRFQDSENPAIKDFYILDLKTKRICWQSESIVFVKIHSNKIYGYEKTAENKKNHKIISLEDHSEKTVERIEFDRKIKQITEAQGKNKAFMYPFYYPEDHAYFATVVAFLSQFLHIHPVKGCEYLEHQRAILISYYIYEEKSLANYLLVIDKAQKILLHDKIGSQLEGIGTDTFFVVKNRLIFIKEKHQLISYALDHGQ